MKAPSPAFSFYPKDLLTDERVRVMTYEELGVYVYLLSHAWLEGSIPSDVTLLARMLRVTHRRMSRIWTHVGPCFEPQPGAKFRLIQTRLERERAKQIDASQRNSEKGMKGAKSRWHNNGSKPVPSSVPSSGYGTATSQGMPGDGLPFPSPSPSPTPTPLPPPSGSDGHAESGVEVSGESTDGNGNVTALGRVWARILARMTADGLDPVSIRSFLSTCTPESLADGVLTVQCATRGHAQWVPTRYGPAVRKAAQAGGADLEVVFVEPKGDGDA